MMKCIYISLVAVFTVTKLYSQNINPSYYCGEVHSYINNAVELKTAIVTKLFLKIDSLDYTLSISDYDLNISATTAINTISYNGYKEGNRLIKFDTNELNKSITIVVKHNKLIVKILYQKKKNQRGMKKIRLRTCGVSGVPPSSHSFEKT